MTFDDAVERLRAGERVKRRAWDEACYLSLIPRDFRRANGTKLFSEPLPRPEIHPSGEVIVENRPDPDNWEYQTFSPWAALDDDLAADDWLAKDGALRSRWEAGSNPGWFARLLDRVFK